MGFHKNYGSAPAGFNLVDIAYADGRVAAALPAVLVQWSDPDIVEWRPHVDAAKVAFVAKAVEAHPPPEPALTGGSNDYYKVRVTDPTTPGADPYTAECNDIIEALGMTFAEGNIFKALWRSCAARTLGMLKPGMGPEGVYDAEKMVFFSNRVLSMRKGDQ